MIIRPEIIGEIRTKILSRRSVSESGCWIASGFLDRQGYGQIGFDGKLFKIHRVSYAAFVGQFPDHLCVLHRCDNPSCINPDHLFVGTRKDNAEDMVRKGRSQAGRTIPKRSGEKNGRAKITNDQACEIRRRYRAGGISQKGLATEYGVNKSTIGHIVRGESFAQAAGLEE